MGFLDLSRRRRISEAADALYAKAVAQARHERFYSEGEVPDSLDGRFDLLVLHMFLLLRRLGAEGAATRRLAQSLFDLMFADMDQSLREMGVSDMGVGKKVKDMAKALYGRIEAYEPVLSDPAGLEAALARNLYRGAAPAPAILAAMARYVALQAQWLAGRSVDDLSFCPPVLS